MRYHYAKPSQDPIFLSRNIPLVPKTVLPAYSNRKNSALCNSLKVSVLLLPEHCVSPVFQEYMELMASDNSALLDWSVSTDPAAPNVRTRSIQCTSGMRSLQFATHIWKCRPIPSAIHTLHPITLFETSPGADGLPGAGLRRSCLLHRLSSFSLWSGA